jgi:hypothetical protein
MSHGYAITARALDANSPRSSFEPLPPRLQRKIAAIECHRVIWTRPNLELVSLSHKSLTADLLVSEDNFSSVRNAESVVISASRGLASEHIWAR